MMICAKQRYDRRQMPKRGIEEGEKEASSGKKENRGCTGKGGGGLSEVKRRE